MDPRKGRHTKFIFLGNRTTLGSVEIVRNFLVDLVDRIGMKALDKPHCYSIPICLENLSLECEEDEGGITGVVVLSTSHASIHTFPEHQYAVVDVYSCKEYDPNLVVFSLVEYFRADREKMFISDLSFSLRFPFGLPKHSVLP